MFHLFVLVLAVCIMVFVARIMYTAPLSVTIPILLICAGMFGWAITDGPTNPEI
jgi:hypothetical protein